VITTDPLSGPTAVLDACALVPIRLATTLLWLAEAGVFEVLWSTTTDAADFDAAEAERRRIITPGDGPVSDRVPAPVVNPALEEPPRTRLVFDRVARVVGHRLRILMEAQDRFEVGGDWMTQSQPRGPQLVVRPLRFHSPHANGVGTAGFCGPQADRHTGCNVGASGFATKLSATASTPSTGR
jgi:hypothetical protein